MLKLNLFFLTFFCLLTARAEYAISGDFTVSGASALDYGTGTVSTQQVLQTIYGGIAGAGCTDGGANASTCNSCASDTVNQACNQTSVYGALRMIVNFKLSKDLTNLTANARAEIFAGDSQSTLNPVHDTNISNPIVGATGSLYITWNEIFGTLPSTDGVVTKYIGIGVDTNNSGVVETADEVRIIPVKLHVVAAGSTLEKQVFCATASASNRGACNVTLRPGDQKAIITAIPQSIVDDPTGLPWDGIAFFPIKVDGTPGSDDAAFTSFNRSAVSPIIRTMKDGVVKDNYITGGLENYQRYCFVYGTRNKAQNIYGFVTADAAAVPTACVTPSEVVGILEDKHCFISTAAFGSDMASEVQTFREFRNQFLLTNSLGRAFIKFYYQEGPAAAEFISQSEILKSVTRGILYPFLGFAYVAIHYGILVALLALAVLLILASQVKRFVFASAGLSRNKNITMMLFILLLTPLMVKADDLPQTKSVQHPGAADGLIRIRKDGTYIYEVKRPMGDQSSSIRFGQGQNPTISIDIEQKNPNGTVAGNKNYTFDDFYPGASKLSIGYDYEKFLWVGAQGKLGWQAGGSVMYAQGQGRLVAASGGSDIAEEKFTFFTVPITAGAVYRLEWKDKQLFAPYVSGGGTYLLLAEKREDKSTPNFAGGFGGYASGGVLVNLGILDPDSSYTMDTEYGITNMWLAVEFKVVEVQAEAFGFSNQILSAGLSFDF